MHATQFKIPEINPFVNYIAELIQDESALQKEQENAFTATKEMTNQLSNQDVVLYEMMLQNIHAMNADVQSVILENANTNSFKQLLVAKMYCKDEAINQFLARELDKSNTSYFLSNPSRVFLNKKFEEIISKSNLDQKKKVLELYRNEGNYSTQSKSYAKITLEKTLAVSSFAIKIIGIIGAIYVGLTVLTKSSEIIEFCKAEVIEKATIKLINHVHPSLISLSFRVYDLRYRIMIAYLVVSDTRLNQYRIIKLPLLAIYKIVWAPCNIAFELAVLPLRLGYKISDFIWSRANLTEEFMRDKSSFLQSARMVYELSCAKDLWVDQVMKLKVEARSI